MGGLSFTEDFARFWAELRRRRVVRVSVYYLAGALAAIQAVDVLLDAFALAGYMRWVVSAAVGGFPLALVLAWVFDITPGGIERTPALAEFEPPERSIAVLPLANLGGEAASDYFSDGLAEEIRNELARLPELRVAARTSSFAFKGRHEDVRAIGRRLNVAAVLEGGVRRQADIVRISLHLVSTRDGFQLWAGNFERTLDDVFRLQSEVARAVSDAILARHAGDEPASASAQAGNFEAWNHYLLGRHHFHRRTEAALARAIDCFQRAITADPGYALAFSGLADAWSLMSSGYYGNLPVAEALARALPAAERALELAPGLAEAHASIGLIRRNRNDFAGAEQALRRALELDPGYSMAHVWLALVMSAQGRYREAAQIDAEAFRVDPLSPIVNTNAGFDALRAGRLDEAATRFGTAIDVEPMFPVPYSGMARLHMARGAPGEALVWTDRAVERAPTRAFYLARKAVLLMQLGDMERAGEWIAAAARQGPGSALVQDLRVGWLVAGGDREALARIARREDAAGTAFHAAQAWIALGDETAALALYEELAGEICGCVGDLVNADWPWRLPHLLNLSRLRMARGDARGRRALEELVTEIDALQAEDIRSADSLYWATCALALLGEESRALERFEAAIALGWRHLWWSCCDRNLGGLAGNHRFVRSCEDLRAELARTVTRAA